MIRPDFSNIHVVLVNTSHPGNIGAAARALKNMGIPNLRLVDPRDYPSDVAVWRSASATDVLERAEVFPDLQAAVSDCALVIGASARSRKMPWPVLTPRQCANHVVADAGQSKVALVFGREDSGLNNEELQLCHYHVQIPADEAYSSLNLAAAVMVICYEVRLAMLEAQKTGQIPQPVNSGDFYDPSVEAEYWDVPKADNHQLELFYEHLEQVLVDMDFHDPKNPRLLMPRMRRLFGRIRPDAMEINILRGVLTYIDDHVRRANAHQDPENNQKDK
ncbi:RNA methyltransferase [Pseudohongiella spirulinae]|uniref:tRNA (cytidine/uridine-2'-O-)-methyltransferase TrmJ n=1 Tax=Pseudohongiella spirulinae TaxID=1249552 RepID=A0A0S2KEE5_9GAMM|nr:RNA methyltransferase [Pseudohongiella spirulinae]ALO46688.1 RNA methyltransferase, TrmH family, group 1 [Pseudohongiella spirulinae]